jgi:Ca-activated chloride channel family protein
MPNAGMTGSNDLLGLAADAATRHIHSTFIGIGLSFNSTLIDRIAKIKGANYFSVLSSEEFKERLDDNFDYMVCPLVYNLSLKLVSRGYQIEKIYGSPEANSATGELMKVNCLFPSPSNEDGEIRGGLVLMRLKKTGNVGDLKLTVNYEMHDGYVCHSEKNVAFEGAETEYYENSGIRKGILLARYAEVMQHWIESERYAGCAMYERYRETWENEAVKLVASDENRALLRNFKKHLVEEISQIKDQQLNREVTLIDKILATSGYIAQYKEEYEKSMAM